MNERIFAIAHYVDQGVLYLLLALCFFSIFMIFERFSYLKKKVKHSKIRQKELKAILESQDYARLEKLTTDLNEVEDRAIHLSLEHYKKYNKSGVDEIFKYVEQSEKPKYEKFLGFLATVGSNGPYIGLFGTVLGIMKAFNDMSATSGGGGGSVMSGISSALIATAAGLMVAIPAVLAFNFFSKQVKGIFLGLDSCKEILFLYEKTKNLES
ncbi:MAG: MotA/TolQ/ExbB proton channel family protein [Bacteriovoracaceae bacterium]|nr:MotA/TolQ/ExbB proton channel family protein [Bacteriovoracaceae bacterium]